MNRPRPPVRRYPRRLRTGVVGAGVALLLAGCGATPDSVAAAAKGAGGQTGYIAGDGTVTRIGPAQRFRTVQISGPTIDGGQLSLQDRTGRVAVLNVWGSWCPPCIQETPDLLSAAGRLKGQPVDFVGINIKESPASAQAFVVARHITWPSLAYEDGRPLLALAGLVPATPTTLVLDRQHRVAARVLGPVDATTLIGLVSDVLTEPVTAEAPSR